MLGLGNLIQKDKAMNAYEELKESISKIEGLSVSARELTYSVIANAELDEGHLGIDAHAKLQTVRNLMTTAKECAVSAIDILTEDE